MFHSASVNMIIHFCIFIGSICLAEWIEIPHIKPDLKDAAINLVNKDRDTSVITLTPQKSSVREVFGVYAQPTTQITSANNFTKLKKNKLDETQKEEISKEGTDNIKGYSAFLSLLKTVQSNLMKNAHKTTKSKLQVLINLRDNLLFNIDERMKQLWPMDDNKQARDYSEHGTSVDFPSNEGALITIGFLTLAVFLVKLVLQVIQIVKTKKQYLNATGINTTVIFGRKKREIDEHSFKILELIDNFNEFQP